MRSLVKGLLFSAILFAFSSCADEEIFESVQIENEQGTEGDTPPNPLPKPSDD